MGDRIKSNRIDGQFAAREIKMLGSPAFRELSLWVRRVLDRLEIDWHIMAAWLPSPEKRKHSEKYLDDLADLPSWVTWREEQRDEKEIKVPYDPKSGCLRPIDIRGLDDAGLRACVAEAAPAAECRLAPAAGVLVAAVWSDARRAGTSRLLPSRDTQVAPLSTKTVQISFPSRLV